jgi:hypothetical protein
VEEEAGMGSDQEDVVAKVAEVADAALSGWTVAHGSGEVDEWGSGLGKADGEQGVEVESASEVGRLHDIHSGEDGIDAETEKGAAEVRVAGLKTRPEVGYAVAESSDARGVRAENGNAHDETLRVGRGGLHKAGEVVGVMLSVGIEDSGMGEALFGEKSPSGKNSGAFSRIAGLFKEVETVFLSGEGCDALAATVIRTIENDHDRSPDGEDGAHRLHEQGAGVVAGDEDGAAFVREDQAAGHQH